MSRRRQVMPPHVRHSRWEQAMFAVRRPDMLWRKIRGKDLIEIKVDEVAPYLPSSPVILEAGAFNGADTTQFARRWPGAVIYSFEPVPELYDEARQRTADLAGVRLYPLALSGQRGSAVMHVAHTAPGINRASSSMFPRPNTPVENAGQAYSHDIEVQAVTIADWAEGEGVDRIDFMWLDMEGMELPVLRAAGPLLATVRAVCMEVGRDDFYVGAPVYGEIVSWMKGQGFRIAIDRVTLWFGNILFVRD
jgi:FkbM family methyltransferase